MGPRRSPGKETTMTPNRTARARHGSVSGSSPCPGCASVPCGWRHSKDAAQRRQAWEGVGAPGVTRTPGTQFRKLLSVVEDLDISTAASGLAGPRRAWTAAAASETRRRSAARGARGAVGSPLRFLLAGARNHLQANKSLVFRFEVTV